MRAIFIRLLSLRLFHQLITLITKVITPSSQNILDIVFVMPPKNTPSWILNAICIELASRFDGLSVQLINIGDKLPPSRLYFFSHYAFYYRALRIITPVRLGRSFIFVTHLESGKNRISDCNVARLLTISDGAICMNSLLRDSLISLGLPKQIAHVVLGAADCLIFKPHSRTHDGKVGFCNAFYSRKAPEKILDIVRKMPHRNFILLGRGWRSWDKFAELCALPNFTYAEPEYKDYPSWYSKMSVYCSVSLLEGGPIPLIEAMCCNVVPVVSRTGFAPDIIQNGENGFLFDVDAPVSEICQLIDKAYEIRRDVNEISSYCDWSIYSRHIAKIMGIDQIGHI